MSTPADRINLLPPWRAQRWQARLRARRWIGLLTAWCGVLSMAAVWARTLDTGVDSTPQRRLDAARARVAGENAELVTVRAELAAVQQRLSTAKAVADHPDWSRLLTLLARVRGEDTVIESLTLARVEAPAPARTPSPPTPNANITAPAGAPAAVPPPRPRERYSLALTGLAKSAGAVTRLVLSLEQTRAFSGVKLVETRPTVVGASAASSFRIDCELAEREEAPR